MGVCLISQMDYFGCGFEEASWMNAVQLGICNSITYNFDNEFFVIK